jgi:Mce-associated membrane protein
MTMIDERTTDPDEVETEPQEYVREEPDSRDRWWTSLPTLVVIALAWLVVVGGVLAWQRGSDLQAEKDQRREAAQVAGDFTTAVLSYDHRDLSGSLDDVLALATPEWGRSYEDAWFSDQQPVIEELQAVAEVDVREVMVGEEQDGVLPATVVFNATIESQIGVRRLGGSYLRIDLTQVDGEWRVENMAFLATTDQSLDPAGGAGQGGGQGGGQGEAPAGGN